ncbi:MAG TPA: hypothetical protein VG099_24780, partial [Gemmataceae bacterium]|nr:hypothetical protein [Gemmataceae bacterium]
MRKRALALLAASTAVLIGPSPTWAQAPTFPQTMPASTVYGRSATSSGPGQAIPFSSLLGYLLSYGSFPTPPSIMSFGTNGSSTCNGVVDDTMAFAAAAVAVPLFTLPPGANCQITPAAGGIVLSSTPGMGIIGAGEGSSIITINSTSAKGIVLPAGAVEPVLRDFQITRTGTAAAGATNLDISGGTTGGLLSDIVVKNGYNNIVLGPTDHGQIRHVISGYAQNHCFSMANTAGNGSMQWQFYNDDLGYYCNGNALDFTVVAGPSQITFGEIVSFQSYANTGHGINVSCSSSVPCNGLRIRAPFLGSDGSDEIYLNTFNTTGGTHTIDAPTLELAGTGGTGTGCPSSCTSASNVGTAIYITANNGEINVLNPTITNISTDGIYNLSTSGNYTGQGTPILNINGGSVTNVGLGGNTSLARGVTSQGSGELLMRGVRSGNLAGTTQQYGVTVAGSTVHNIIAENDLRGNSTSALV